MTAAVTAVNSPRTTILRVNDVKVGDGIRVRVANAVRADPLHEREPVIPDVRLELTHSVV